MPEEYVVSLIVKGDGPATLEFRLIVEKCTEHSTNGEAKASRKIVQYHFWPVLADLFPIAFQFWSYLHVTHLEMRRWTIWQVHN